MILYGGYARGALRRGTPVRERAYRAMVDLARADWGNDNPTFRQVFTSRFIPGASPEQLKWFNELCLKTTSAEVAATLLRGARRDGHFLVSCARADADTGHACSRRRSRSRC